MNPTKVREPRPRADGQPPTARDQDILVRPVVQVLTVGDDGADQRIDNYLLKLLKGVPKSHVYRILRSGEVRLNGRRAAPDTRVSTGDRIRIPPVRSGKPDAAVDSGRVPAGPPVTVLREDDALLALDKPAGLAVHGGSGVDFGLIERLRLQRPDARFLELVHRLDRETSGVLLVAKKRAALVSLHHQLRDGQVDKRYAALVQGAWRDALRRVNLPLETYVTAAGERRVRTDEGGREARTVFRRLAVWRDAATPVALLEAELETGRTHQIRVHLAHLGHPIAGDPKYGDFAWNRELARQGLKRMFLHAAKVRFMHPITGETEEIAAPLPPELAQYVAWLDASATRSGESR